MSFDNTKIVHLEDSDFNGSAMMYNGKPITSGKFFIMVHADFCGYCRKAKPAFMKAAEIAGTLSTDNGIIFASIHSDSPNNKETLLAKKLPQISGLSIRGIPTFILYDAQTKKFTVYEGDRTAQGFLDFLKRF